MPRRKKEKEKDPDEEEEEEVESTAETTTTRGGGGGSGRSVASRVNKEIARMMYGAGDVKQPLPESVALMESIIRRYMRDVTALALRRERASVRDPNALLYVIRRDTKKYRRAKELLARDELIRKARSRFSDNLASALRDDDDDDDAAVGVDGAALLEDPGTTADVPAFAPSLPARFGTTTARPAPAPSASSTTIRQEEVLGDDLDDDDDDDD